MLLAAVAAVGLVVLGYTDAHTANRSFSTRST